MVSASDIIDVIKIHPLKIRNIFLFGSQIYGNQRDDSDYDFIVVACNMLEKQEIRHENLNIHVHTPDIFLNGLKEYQMNYLECIYAPDWAKLKETIKFDSFKINKNKLINSISHTSSNSWVKCNKKINVENEYYIGVKSLFHSIRIPMFAIQIAESGEIYDFSCANFIWDKIKKKHWTWGELDREFRPLLNQTMTQLRKFLPKK